ncbi:MAG: AMP-binding protein, partial [Aureliella sp.]
MAWEVIQKQPAAAVQPNLVDYTRARQDFSWQAARRELSGLPAGGLNIAHEAIDRHALGPLRDKTAIRWLGKDGQVEDFSYDRLRRATNRFANVLERLGVRAGDRVFALTGRIPTLYIAAMGTLKHRSIFCPMFSAFGPEPIKARLRIGQGRVLVTTQELYEKKIAPQRQALPDLEIILLVTTSSEPDSTADWGDGVYNLSRWMDEASDQYAIPPTDPEDPALLHFTSGTTGSPKGAIHVHDAVTAHHITGRLALDLHPDDIFWCTADPGWVTGTSYGIIAPLTNGVTSIVDEADFDASRWYDILQQQQVTVWYTAPTAIRTLMRVGAELAREHDLSKLRFAASVGEPLNPEGVVWGLEAFD